MAPNTDCGRIPANVANVIAAADDSTLGAIVDFARAEIAERRRDLLEIEPRPGEELVEVSDEPGYTSVVLRQPCADECDDCPHGPYLYHVRPERHPDGEASLHWVFLGLVGTDGVLDGASNDRGGGSNGGGPSRA